MSQPRVAQSHLHHFDPALPSTPLDESHTTSPKSLKSPGNKTADGVALSATHASFGTTKSRWWGLRSQIALHKVELAEHS